MTWVLVLTLITSVHSGTAAVVTPVPGFTSRESCLNAGNSWLKTTDEFPTIRRNALCVPQS